MKKYTWQEKFQYHFDNMMSRGTVSLIGLLFGITLVVVLLAGVLVGLINPDEGVGVGSSMWLSLMHAIDAGTLAGDEGNWLFLLVMTLVTICGLFITSMLIGILNAGIEDKMTSLQKGKSLILESNHTVILGFNENALNMISELIIANENQKDEVIVVMDDVDKTMMEDAIHQWIDDTKTTRIICRSGQIDRFADLSICSLETCRSIILNLEDDARTIKAILACVHLLEKSDNKDAYISAMIHEAGNMEAAQIAGKDRTEILYFKQTIARLMANASRQPGISNVFTNLLSYDGDEIYVEAVAGSEGKTIAELNRYFPKSIVIGVVNKNGSKINPPKETVVEAGDQLILIEEDDGVSVMSAQPARVAQEMIAPETDIVNTPQRSLILGNGEMLELVLNELDCYVAPDSVVVAANSSWKQERPLAEHLSLNNIRIEQKTCDIFSREVLEELLLAQPENVMILTDQAYDDDLADANTLLLLLQMSSIAEKHQLEFTVVSEMRKVENQELAKITKVNDFVVSSNITALMMAQISQNREQRALLEDLLDDDGSEFYRKPAARYVQCGEPVDFYTVGAAAARYGEIAIGYQLVREHRFYTVTNPEKAEKITFMPEDALIVIAED